MDILSKQNLTKAEFISRQKLDQLSSEAKQSPRLRKNYNFHTSDEDICHRLLNAMEPDSYMQPHRHLNIDKDETLVVVRGRIGIIMFDDDGTIKGNVLLEPTGSIMMVNIPHGIFHTCVSLEERTVFFESKAGPFVPLTPEERANWAPKENDEAVNEYLASLKKLFESNQ
ncbi:MAG: WbuC family cupin fold metalloprotein [Smithella sp.]